MDLIFLGTGAAWGLPELNCHCMICCEMRRNGERRQRTRTKGEFEPIGVYITEKSWEVVRDRFRYLEEMGIIGVQGIEPNRAFTLEEYEFIPFKTNHGPFALGSVGFIIKTKPRNGRGVRLVYTSDFIALPEPRPDLIHPDYLIIQSFWLNEPVENRPHHMSFQRALEFIELWQPKVETFLVHMGDGEAVPGDPANKMAKKYRSAGPLRYPKSADPYSVPLNQEQWQRTVDQIIIDRDSPFKITVAYDDLRVQL